MVGNGLEEKKGPSSPEDKESLQTVQETKKWKKEIFFVTLFVAIIFSNSTYSVMAPIFPREADTRGVSYTIQGMIFGCYALTQVCIAWQKNLQSWRLLEFQSLEVCLC